MSDPKTAQMVGEIGVMHFFRVELEEVELLRLRAGYYAKRDAELVWLMPVQPARLPGEHPRVLVDVNKPELFGWARAETGRKG